MLRIVFVVLYTALMPGANGARADQAAAEAVLSGDMRKLTFHASAKTVPAIALVDMAGAPRSLDEWKGRWVVLNFWATWCAPCRKEMPQIAELQQEFGGELNFWATWCAPCRKEMPGLARLAVTPEGKNMAVVTVATGRNPVPSMKRFLREMDAQNLPVLRDPKSQLASAIGVLGLPVTVLLDPEGKEVARLIGDADWDGKDARAMLAALTAD